MRRKPPPRTLRPPALSVDPEKYPRLGSNPALERALRIRQAMDKGMPRDEAVALAAQAMGPRAPVMMRSRPASPRGEAKARKPAKARPAPRGKRLAH